MDDLLCRYADWQETFGKDNSEARAQAARIEASLVPTFLNEDEMLNRATEDNAQTDMMGTCRFLVQLSGRIFVLPNGVFLFSLSLKLFELLA